MNKDTIIASFIGFGLGLIAAIMLWVVPRVLPKNPSTATTIKQEIAGETTQKTEANTFEITSPSNGAIVESDTVKISGTANGAKLVIVGVAANSTVVIPDASGNFSADVTLIEGGNEITITKHDAADQESKNLFIYYYSDSI